ncbi:hypothetical protein [Archangium sp.]|nr:hypothetical protein [Archangium sp.]HYO54528.1 hypothetical protein [Archangium sp.]
MGVLEAEALLGAEALLTVRLPEDKARHVHERVRALEAPGQQGRC